MRSGKVGSVSYDGRRASGSNHPPVIISFLLAVIAAVYPIGVLLTKGLDGVFVALQEILAEVIATGNGALTNFTGTFAVVLPVTPGSVVITDGVETFTDDGYGNLIGDGGGSGTIIYSTGAYDVTFAVAVVDTVDITADYITEVSGVLDTQIDTDDSDQGPVIIHGSVVEVDLVVDPAAPAAPSVKVKQAMIDAGIYLE